MNKIKKDEIFQTLQRFTSIVKQSSLLATLSELVEINFALVGGCVRDTVLDKPIKDVDILVHFNFYHKLKINYSSSNYSHGELKNMHDKSDIEEAEALEQRNYQIQLAMEDDIFFEIRKMPNYPKSKFNAVTALICLTEYLITNHPDYGIYQRFEKKKSTMPINELEMKKVAYKLVGLNAVLGIVDKKSNYPVEILFTQDHVDNFVHNFDFNLCKIKMIDTDGQAEIVPTILFLQDQDKMTMTYQPEFSITQEQMNKSLLVRYERLQKKFPEYELITDVTNINENMKETVEQTVKSVRLYHQMKNLSEKTSLIRINKI